MTELNQILKHVAAVCRESKDFTFTTSEIEIIQEVVEKCHITDGLFSIDKIFDELRDLLGDNEKTVRLFNAIV